VLPDNALGALQATLQGGDAQLVIFDPQKDLISDIDAKSLAKGSGDHDAAILIDAQPGFCIHDNMLALCHILFNVTHIW